MSHFLKSFISSARKSASTNLKSTDLLTFIEQVNEQKAVVKNGCRLLWTVKGQTLHTSQAGRASVVLAFQDGTESFIPCSKSFTSMLQEALQQDGYAGCMALLGQSSVFETEDGRGFLSTKREDDGI